MGEVSMYKVRNIYILARLRIPDMENFIHFCRLVWMGEIASCLFLVILVFFLNAWIPTPRLTGRPSLTTHDSFLKSLKYCNDHSGADFKTITFTNGKLDQ